MNPIQHAGELARRGTILNAAIATCNIAAAGFNRKGPNLIDYHTQRRWYSQWLTRVLESCGVELEWWER